jgi:ubiquinone/menaquinone biosynthesis C-methylase UbiE
MRIESLLELIDFWPSRIILTAVELGIFSALTEPLTAPAVAKAIGADPRATYMLLNALVALEVLELRNREYTITAELQQALGQGPDSVLHALAHRAYLWRTWNELTHIVREGEPQVEPYERDERPDEQVQTFIGAMAVSGRKLAGETAAKLGLAGIKTVLDVGGGPAVYAEEFCRAENRLKATVLDFPRVCELARKRLADTAQSEVVSFVSGEARNIESEEVLAANSGEGYDLVFTSNLIHSMDEMQVQVLLSRMVSWTKSGGRVAVKDFLMNDSRTFPARGAIFAINMLVNTPGGRTYQWSEIERWLADAAAANGRRLAATERIQLEDGNSGIVVGTLDIGSD